MATDRQQQFIGALANHLAQVGSLNIDALVQRDRLGTEMSFEKGRSIFLEIVSTFAELAKVNFEKVPYGVLQQLLSGAQTVNNVLAQVANFSPAQHGNGVAARDSLIQQIEDQWNNIFLPVRAVLGPASEAAIRQEADHLASQVSSLTQAATQAVANIQAAQGDIEQKLQQFLKEQADAFRQQGEQKLIEVDKALESVRKLAAEAGVSQHAKYFDEEANYYKAQTQRWLSALVVSGVLLLGYALAGNYLIEQLIPSVAVSSSPFGEVRILTQRALLASVFLFAVYWSARNFSAARHNEVLNRHRRNSLGSFETFVKSASDEATKNAVLVQAAQSIFSPQQTGYVKSDGDHSAPTQILEFVRGGEKK